MPDPPVRRVKQKSSKPSKQPKAVAINTEALQTQEVGPNAKEPGPPLGSKEWIEGCASNYRGLATIAAAVAMIYGAYDTEIAPAMRGVMAAISSGCVYGLLRGPFKAGPTALAHATAWSLRIIGFVLKMLIWAAGLGFVGFLLLQVLTADVAGK